MKYTYKGLDITENEIQAYKDNNKIIGSAIMDINESFGIITYEISSKKISSYKYKISEYQNLNTFNNFTAIVMQEIVYIFQEVKMNKLMI